VLAVRKGTQDELKAAGYTVDKDSRDTTPYYVDARYANKGSRPLKRDIDVGLEDEDGNLIGSTLIFNYGNKPYAKCTKVNEGRVAPGQSFESCTLFLVPNDKAPGKVSFLPNQPGTATDFVYWSAE
jgi:hypothetical protein